MNITVIKEFIDNLPEDLMNIVNAIEYYGFDCRVVGGAVRDLVLDIIPRDIDIATDATPDEIIFILSNLNDEMEFQEIDPKSIQHGTIKVLTKAGNLYEITSLAYKIKERNQHINIKQHRDWKIDALRRDFTVNTLSLSPNGIIYDYLNGLNDLINQRIKFVGFYKVRMMLEPILILRFAKILTKFPEPKYNISILTFISKNRNLIDGIKKDTLQWFLEEIQNSIYPESAEPVLQALRIAPKVY